MQSHPSRPWETFHRRADVLRAVIAYADSTRDGELPTHLAGVEETFDGPTDLVASLQLRWHTRLAGTVERALADQPADLEAAVVDAWRAAAEDLAGIRLVLDRQARQPATPELADVLERAAGKDRTLLAVMSGRAGLDQAAAGAAGRAIEERARAGHDPRTLRPDGAGAHRHDEPGLISRIRAVLAA